MAHIASILSEITFQVFLVASKRSSDKLPYMFFLNGCVVTKTPGT